MARSLVIETDDHGFLGTPREVLEGVVNGLECSVEIEVIRGDIGDHRNGRPIVHKRTVRLVCFNDEELVVPPSRRHTPLTDDAAINGASVATGSLERRGEHGR